jgi:hypothetical protein
VVEGGPRPHGIIIRFRCDASLVLLEPSSRLEMARTLSAWTAALRGWNILVDLLVESWPVCDRAIQCSDVDEVEAIRLVQPFERAVVDFELQIRWDICRLDRRQVCAYDLRVRVLVTVSFRLDSGIDR